MNNNNFAGFLPRLGAFLIDCLLLGLVGAGAGYFAFDALVQIGVWGRLVGFLVALAYFAPLNSSLGNGQTLGKRLLKIKVVGIDGAPLPLQKSLLRFAVLGTPWFLNNAMFPMEVLASPAIYLLALVIFGLGLAILYLFIFNRPSRQSLHDLAVGSYVIRAETAGPIGATPLWRTHLIVVGVLFIVSTAAPYIATRMSAKEPFVSLLQANHAVSEVPGVSSAQVSKGWSTSAGGKSTYLQVTANLSEPRIEDQELARRVAKAALDADPSAMSVDVVQVVLVYGFDIGIATMRRTHAHNNTPADWIR